MITTEEALKIIAAHVKSFGTEVIPLAQGVNRILKEDWFADRDMPPYNRVSMDGIAIQYNAFVSGNRIFEIEGIAAAGSAQNNLQDPSSCLEVMTGSVLPLQTDTVIRYEDLELKDGKAKILVETIAKGQNVHTKGKDRKADSLIVPSDTKISAAEIGIGASLGRANIIVARLPRVIVISTGDELVEINETPLAHQIRKSNVSRLTSSLEKHNIIADTAHLNDDRIEIKTKMETFLNCYDVVILSGGVSKGKFDFIPEVLDSLGVEKLFHKIKQRPGKPFWFGQFNTSCTVFAFPGNPVSSFLCMQRYFLYWLHSSLLQTPPKQAYAILQSEIYFKPDLTYFLEVEILYSDSGEIYAQPKKGNGSGDLANLALGDAFIELPRGKDVFFAGEVYPIFFYR